MALQIKNRREDLYINEVPPEILTEAKLSTDGFVKNTDYAAAGTGGVIKVSSSYGITVNTTGLLVGSARTAEQYAGGGTTLIISKGTLENVIASLVTKAIADLCGALDSDDVGTTYTMQCVEKTADGYTFVGGKTPPMTP